MPMLTVKAVDTPRAKLGDALAYTVRLDNRPGTAAATNVIFRDSVPSGTSFIANSLSIDGVASPGADPAAAVVVMNCRRLM